MLKKNLGILIALIGIIITFLLTIFQSSLVETYEQQFQTCIDGKVDLIYTNCEYNFEYTIPTDNWTTWDDKKKYAILPSIPPEPGLLSWAQNAYSFYTGSLPSTYMTVQVFDIIEANFTDYNSVKIYWEEYIKNDPDKKLTFMGSQMNYTTYLSKWQIGNFTFDCTAYLHQHNDLLYIVDGCYDEGYVITPILLKELHSMFKSFRFLD